MNQLILNNLPTPVLLVWGLPEYSHEFVQDKGTLTYKVSEFYKESGRVSHYEQIDIPEGNWQLISKLSELTDFKTRKAIKDKGYHIMNPYMMPNSRNYSASQLENDNSDYWNKYNKWQEAQSKTLPANTLIFKKS